MKNRSPNALLQFQPKRQGSHGPAGVNFIRAIAHPNNSRFSPRTSPAIPRRIGIAQQDPTPSPLQKISGPRPEHTGPNPDHIEFRPRAHKEKLFPPKIRAPSIHQSETAKRQTPSVLSSKS